MHKQSHCAKLNIHTLITLSVLQLCYLILKKQAYDEEIHSLIKRDKEFLPCLSGNKERSEHFKDNDIMLDIITVQCSQKPLITGQPQMKHRTDRE